MLKVCSIQNTELQKQVLDLTKYLKDILFFAKESVEILKDLIKSANPQLLTEVQESLFKIRENLAPNYDQDYSQDYQEYRYRKQGIVVHKKEQQQQEKKQLFNRSLLLDKLNHPGIVITKLVRTSNQSLNQMTEFNAMPCKHLLQWISTFYDQKCHQSRESIYVREQELEIFIFNKFVTKYTLPNQPEQKFTLFLMSLLQNCHIFRINMFCKLISLFEDRNLNYTIDEMKQYLDGLDFLVTTCKLGVNIPFIPTQLRRYVPFLRALEFIKVFSENRLNQGEICQLKNEIEQLKEPDAKYQNKFGMIDVDLFLARILQKYRIIMARTKDYVVNAFRSSDLDGNGMCDQNEFLLLFRHIESDRFFQIGEQKVIEIYEDSADLFVEGEKQMSFERFTAVCVDFFLFSDEIQNQFLGINTNQEIEINFEKLQKEWSNCRNRFVKALEDLSEMLEESQKEKWEEILDALEEKVLGDSNTVEEKKQVLIACRVMELEFERLLWLKENEADDENDFS